MTALRSEKMDKIYIRFFVSLSLLYGCSAKIYKEGAEVNVECDHEQGAVLTFWFRIEAERTEYLFAVKGSGQVDGVDVSKYKFSSKGAGKGSLSFKFNKKTYSGLYSCAGFNKNKLHFGPQTDVQGEPDPTQAPKPEVPTTVKSTIKETTTTKPCITACKESKTVLKCETWILASLAGGCVLLLILLIVTILYCNRLRTRRCPHHYKRKPQPRPAGHAKLPNTHF